MKKTHYDLGRVLRRKRDVLNLKFLHKLRLKTRSLPDDMIYLIQHTGSKYVHRYW